MKTIISQNLNGRTVLLLIGMTQIIYFIMLKVTIPAVESYAEGMAILDMIPFGSGYEYTINLLQNLGDDGRLIYRSVQLPIDMAYPFFFAISYGMLISYLIRKLDYNHSALSYLPFIPIAAGIFDYLENISIYYLLDGYPNVSVFDVTVSNSMTIIKSGFSMVSILIITALLIIFSYQKWIAKSSN
jgi:hypothetical protein